MEDFTLLKQAAHFMTAAYLVIIKYEYASATYDLQASFKTFIW